MQNKLSLHHTSFDKLFIIKQHGYSDDRGDFDRLFCINELNDILQNKQITQINHSLSKKKGSFRGFHFQYPPFAEAKIIKCIRGSVFDIAVDIRKGSKTFLQNFSITLSAMDKQMIYLPEGFAHGFLTLDDNTELLYLHTNSYNKDKEGGININDTRLDIKLPSDIINISKKDTNIALLDDDFLGVDI
jgi:dTDP-4-dehydrorhamnose 3,5-epimerase